MIRDDSRGPQEYLPPGSNGTGTVHGWVGEMVGGLGHAVWKPAKDLCCTLIDF